MSCKFLSSSNFIISSSSFHQALTSIELIYLVTVLIVSLLLVYLIVVRILVSCVKTSLWRISNRNTMALSRLHLLLRLIVILMRMTIVVDVLILIFSISIMLNLLTECFHGLLSRVLPSLEILIRRRIFLSLHDSI